MGHAPPDGGGESRSPQFQPPSRRSHIWHDLTYGGSLPIFGKTYHLWGGGSQQRHRDTGTQGHRDKHRQKHFPHMESLAMCKTSFCCLCCCRGHLHEMPGRLTAPPQQQQQQHYLMLLLLLFYVCSPCMGRLSMYRKSSNTLEDLPGIGRQPTNGRTSYI